MINRGAQHGTHSGSNLLAVILWRLLSLSAVLGTFLYTSVADLHEESHAHDEEQHEECLVCLIFTGSIDPTSPEPIQIAVLRSGSDITVLYGSDSVFSSGFWVVISARPPPVFG